MGFDVQQATVVVNILVCFEPVLAMKILRPDAKVNHITSVHQALLAYLRYVIEQVLSNPAWHFNHHNSEACLGYRAFCWLLSSLPGNLRYSHSPVFHSRWFSNNVPVCFCIKDWGSEAGKH
ncbi:hypothetical protein ONS95_013908 [Cadophora gregata]|uniref:uncharacterized protein n=1 Tax=Cadophora gregata TaxID=51156 RepID=UPI0026DC4606|nr:uncharacterized protein ONS95_013908 [Cadophora gregata]KAK0114416.1 hypothetical protein ONS95_013908 [Cadophora gregata]